MKNVVEDIVAHEYARLREAVGGLPDTDEFRDDVMAYALNRLSPRYVSQRTGKVVTQLAMQSDQERARVSVIILEAFRVVQETPRDARG